LCGSGACSPETIVAVSTALGVGAIGIVRASGPRAVEFGRELFRRPNGTPVDEEQSHRMWYGRVLDPQNGRVLDEALMVIMRAPGTYTREDIVEIQCHGGPAAQREVLRAFVRLGARPAEPGEFTRRAFLNGRIDLTQAESVAAVVQARSSSALRAAVHQLGGGLSDRLRGLRKGLLAVLATLEVAIDFTDEDAEETDRGMLVSALDEVAVGLGTLLRTAFLGRILEQGVRTAIVGKPNVGKSSLLNALLMRERAIVSEIPGTTRDTVEEFVEIGGVPLRLVDTAGIRESADVVERLGIDRSRQALEEADLVLAVFDGSCSLDSHDRDLLLGLDPDRTLIVANKCDLAGPMIMVARMAEVEHARTDVAGWTACAVSALTGQGLDELRAMVELRAVGEHGLSLDEPFLATERQQGLVQQAGEATRRATEALRAGAAEELVCEDVREAVGALGRVTGEELVPDLLDEVFRRFCIGK
jgi:tRNA modification GTPase